MVKLLKQNDFLLRIERLFTREGADAFDLIDWRESEFSGDETAFEAPGNWSAESVRLMAEESVCPSVPAQTRSIEENTVPSWLWRRAAEGKTQSKETGVKPIFHRVAGSAAYAGWKQDVFADETEAHAFFDEIRYMLAQRFIALEPRSLAASGLDWAYGIEPNAKALSAPAAFSAFETADFDKKNRTEADIRNASIDALLGGDPDMRRKWRKFIAAGAKTGLATLRFADIAADWNAPPPPRTRGALDLLALRREDGSVDIGRLCHTVKLLVVLLELQGKKSGESFAIGFHNLAPLLLSQALPYDSDAARATAAALAALVAAEACATSARLAALLGPGLDFAVNRESVLRALRNRRRAAYGDRNDYEKVSVLPVPLTLDPGADLALIAAARRRWDEALDLTRQHGLHSMPLTDLSPVPGLAFFMESATQGAEPLLSLTATHAVQADVYCRETHPAVAEALTKLGYSHDAREKIIDHLGGMHTLAHAPGIDHEALRRRGFDDEALEKIEDYLPYANDIRLAVTPWILGEEFCRDVLKIPAGKMADPRFDLLDHLGFSTKDIKTANAFCYGSDTAFGAKGLRLEHAAIFATGEISAEARIRMAAVLQSFVSGDAGLCLTAANNEETERLLLAAWRQGVKSVTIECLAEEERTEKRQADAPASHASARAPEKPPTVPLPEYKAPVRSTLRSKPKAKEKLVSLDNSPAHKSEQPRKR